MAIAVFPVMSSEAARKDFGALAKTIAQSLRGVVFAAIPATAGIFLVAKPLVSAIFEHGAFAKPVASVVLENAASQVSHTSIVAWTLSFYAVGLCGYFSQQIVTRAFYSMQDSGTPMRSALAAVVVNVVLNLILIWYMGTAGLALSTAICSYLQVVILMLALRKRIGRSILDGFPLTLIKTVLSTVLMCAVAAVIIHRMGKLPENRFFNILRLAVVVPSAAAVYLLAAKLLRIEMLSLITGRRRR
jgi:putative peptidoglycan lipid II flippase